MNSSASAATQSWRGALAAFDTWLAGSERESFSGVPEQRAQTHLI